MENEIKNSNTVKKIITVMLAALLIVGIGLFDYSCYAVEECRNIDSYYPQETGQIAYAADQAM